MLHSPMVLFFFWLSFALLLYIYIGYPLLIWFLASVRPRPVNKGDVAERFSIVVVAHNEEAHLPRKLKSILCAAGVDQMAELVVASDGSTDGTVGAVSSIGDERIRLVEFPSRRGKPAVLNDVIPTCKSDIIVLLDARQRLDPNALTALLSNFNDEFVGVVSGELVFEGADTPTGEGMDVYWRYEKFIRKNESRFASVPGATGALYAFRKPLFRQLPKKTLLDDVVIPMRAVLMAYRCVFEEEARIYDAPSERSSQEAARKRRTIAGNAQMLSLYPLWLLPWKNPIWFQYTSHKIGRLSSPFLLLGLLAANVALLNHPPYLHLALLQLLFYVFALLGWLLSCKGKKAGIISAPFMFTMLNYVTILALWDAVRGRYRVRWVKSQ